MNIIPRFYPIVPSVDWVGKIVPLGVGIIQLRIKNSNLSDIRSQIQESLKIASKHDCQLVVNDYWDIAIALKAPFVHLGQEDLAAADHTCLKKSGIKIGISTHSPEELEIALKANPFYVALGPIYETKLKVMKWKPQGIQRVRQWRRRIGGMPLVAIGGLTPDKAQNVFSAGATSLAVITDFMTADDPLSRIRMWLECTSRKDKKGCPNFPS